MDFQDTSIVNINREEATANPFAKGSLLRSPPNLRIRHVRKPGSGEGQRGGLKTHSDGCVRLREMFHAMYHRGQELPNTPGSHLGKWQRLVALKLLRIWRQGQWDHSPDQLQSAGKRMAPAPKPSPRSIQASTKPNSSNENVPQRDREYCWIRVWKKKNGPKTSSERTEKEKVRRNVTRKRHRGEALILKTDAFEYSEFLKAMPYSHGRDDPEEGYCAEESGL